MRYRLFISILLSCLCSSMMYAQTENNAIRKGNQLYKKGQYDKALPEYEKAVAQNPNNPVAQYNTGNARFRQNEFAAAEKAYEASVTHADSPAFKQRSLYNKGVSLSKQKKLLESIDAYKNALKLDPADEDTRVNLQKALEELRKQNAANQQQEQKKQPPKPDKQKPQQNTANKKEIQQWLKSLQQKEQEIQQKMQQNRSRSASQQKKDW